jgi:hypothetical protein
VQNLKAVLEHCHILVMIVLAHDVLHDFANHVKQLNFLEKMCDFYG